MDYVNFGRTGVKVSPLTLGCMMFGQKTDLEDTCRIVDRALDGGINVLDTADMYARGRSEEFVGEALARNGKRERVFLCTKVFNKMADDDPNAWGNTRRHIVSGCEASLRRLRVDHIDLYQLHRPQPEAAIDEALRALDDLIRAGKVRYAGTTTFAAWQVVEALWCSKELGLHRFVSEQPPYNLLDRSIDRELLPMARTFGLAVLPWAPLASGLLSGKYRGDRAVPAGSRFADKGTNPILAERWTPESLSVIARVGEMAERRGVPLSQFALAWVMQQPGVTSAIIGPRTAAQLEDNLGAVGLKLSPEELKQIDEIAPPGTRTSIYYTADFGPHPHRW
jgi:aryl-alcohol dehydrogenase-like predicted oxidoreductase